MSSIIDRITNSIVDFQRRDILTKERVLSFRRYLCRSIGFAICLYCLLQLIIVIYLIVKVCFRLMFFILLLVLPTKRIYTIIWLLSTLCSIYLGKFFRDKYQLRMWKFYLPLLVQLLFIVLPLGISSFRHEQTISTVNSSRWFFKMSFPIRLHIKESSSFDEHLNHYTICSIDTAFTDLHCYDYTKSIDLNKQNYIYFLNTYRYRSPFSIYLSIIKSNGPTCHHSSNLNSSCAIPWKLNRKKSSRQLGFILGISMIISLLIFIWLSKNRKSKFIKQSSTNLDPRLIEKFHVYLVEEEKLNYINLLQTINKILSSSDESLKIVRLHYVNARLRQVSQRSYETIVINGILDVEQLLFYLKLHQYDEEFPMKINQLNGQIQIILIDNRMEIQLKDIEIKSIDLIDIHQNISFEEKQSILQLIKNLIHQTVVQCQFHLLDNQPKTKPKIITPSVISPPIPINIQCETPIIQPVDSPLPSLPPSPTKSEKKLLIRIVKAVQLHDVEQPYCILELNHPKQIHQTSLAKNGLNPFWDEKFLFNCTDQTNQIRLQIFDRKKPNKKHHDKYDDTIYADVCIPFAYVTSTIYKQDIRITPQYPDSIIRIEFSTINDDESPQTSLEFNSIQHQTPSDELLTLSSRTNETPIGIDSALPFHRLTKDEFDAILPTMSTDENSSSIKSPKSRSLMSSFRLFTRRKNFQKKNPQYYENGFTSTPTEIIPHSSSIEPVQSPVSSSDLSRNRSISRSFRNFFKRKPLQSKTFTIDESDLESKMTPLPKKRSFFRRFRSKPKQSINYSTNSLTSEDRNRAESTRNTPIRANVGRPVTMT